MRRARRTRPAPPPAPPRFSLAEQADTRTAIADAVTAWAAQRGATTGTHTMVIDAASRDGAPLTLAIAIDVGPRLP